MLGQRRLKYEASESCSDLDLLPKSALLNQDLVPESGFSSGIILPGLSPGISVVELAARSCKERFSERMPRRADCPPPPFKNSQIGRLVSRARTCAKLCGLSVSIKV